ncbi:serine hydrolase [Rhodobacteraceae bacterium R_SAG9]|nr:serine hydrolase [Rhodobacteraceae bacterium R_SAG9]
MMFKHLALVSCVSFSSMAMAAELQPVDEDFLAQVEHFGISQANWDSGEHASVTFPNAYKLTRHYVVDPGNAVAPEVWQDESGSLDFTKLTGLDADGVQTLDTLLKYRLKNHSMVVLKGDRLLHQHFWNGMTPESTHLDMSVTKSFTATLAGIAAAEGKLDMSQPVEAYLPEFKGTAFEGVSIQDVADMNSGLDIKTPPFLSWDPKFTQSQEWNGPNDSGLNGIQDYLLTIDSQKYAPGTHYQYQDPNTEILGLIVEKATGERLADYLEAKIWSKLGAEGPAYFQADAAGNTVASGGLNMRTRDLAKMGRVFLSEGQNHLGEQVVPVAFIDALWEGNDRVRAAWSVGKEAALAPDGWYKDQIRVLNIKGHKIIVFVGIHGQTLVMEPATDTVIAMNGGYPQTETERMNTLLFVEIVPAILEAVAPL